ncbi:phospholipase D/nuclease [Melanomma pulvis-pyrius CBS 109.77]|uniref:Phospholipase D/nuclease n=1 Tax=Melanomma pulvis-pyrius CBS 109.77 TaxID=1314802 RepID=A0A6A6X1W5_9PLEO|nr:phospholipase D/nuclease [Melanomma pulvis-pyrius CBS 109.77]
MTSRTSAPGRRPSCVNTQFISALQSSSQTNAQDDPNYYNHDPRSLISTSTVHSFTTGTGSAIYNSLSKLLESTTQELILVTCFWARSSTLETLNDVLRKLSDKAVRRGTEKIKIRLCFSSLSLFQKLFHSQSVEGQTYSSSVWAEKLGLPSPTELGGLDIQIKSVFILPFSVMHPKFMVIDRQTVILPSCNISWEEWFEGCITFSGPVTDKFLQFYTQFWYRGKLPLLESTIFGHAPAENAHLQDQRSEITDLGHGHIITHFPPLAKTSGISDIPTVFLPSPHRRNPRFRPFTSGDKVIAPSTPLNTFILTLSGKAERSIRIQTPNITSPPVLSALLKALARGIDVRILTSEKLMVLEQLVTAGTTTSRCVNKLIKRYKNLLDLRTNRPTTDEEAAIATPLPGRLQISYFAPMNGPKFRGQEEGEPQQSHLKMMVVDDDVLLLGSGNLDRASWFTSQELGVAFFDQNLVTRVLVGIDQVMKGRTKVVYDSGEESR